MPPLPKGRGTAVRWRDTIKQFLTLQTPIYRWLHHNRQTANHRYLTPTPRGARGVDCEVCEAVGGVGGG